jgi:hypothetical protein
VDADLTRERVLTCILAVAVTIVGVWYAAYGFSLLVYLPQVTRRWILMSGDPDFILDFNKFLLAGAVLALLAVSLGVVSIRWATRAIRAPYATRRHWLWLLALAVVVGGMRTFAEFIAGMLTPWRFVSFTAVCVLYALLWAFDRPAPRVPAHRPALN